MLTPIVDKKFGEKMLDFSRLELDCRQKQYFLQTRRKPFGVLQNKYYLSVNFNTNTLEVKSFHIFQRFLRSIFGLYASTHKTWVNMVLQKSIERHGIEQRSLSADLTAITKIFGLTVPKSTDLRSKNGEIFRAFKHAKLNGKPLRDYDFDRQRVDLETIERLDFSLQKKVSQYEMDTFLSYFPQAKSVQFSRHTDLNWAIIDSFKTRCRPLKIASLEFVHLFPTKSQPSLQMLQSIEEVSGLTISDYSFYCHLFALHFSVFTCNANAYPAKVFRKGLKNPAFVETISFGRENPHSNLGAILAASFFSHFPNVRSIDIALQKESAFGWKLIKIMASEKRGIQLAITKVPIERSPKDMERLLSLMRGKSTREFVQNLDRLILKSTGSLYRLLDFLTFEEMDALRDKNLNYINEFSDKKAESYFRHVIDVSLREESFYVKQLVDNIQRFPRLMNMYYRLVLEKSHEIESLCSNADFIWPFLTGKLSVDTEILDAIHFFDRIRSLCPRIAEVPSWILIHNEWRLLVLAKTESSQEVYEIIKRYPFMDFTRVQNKHILQYAYKCIENQKKICLARAVLDLLNRKPYALLRSVLAKASFELKQQLLDQLVIDTHRSINRLQKFVIHTFFVYLENQQYDHFELSYWANCLEEMGKKSIKQFCKKLIYHFSVEETVRTFQELLSIPSPDANLGICFGIDKKMKGFLLKLLMVYSSLRIQTGYRKMSQNEVKAIEELLYNQTSYLSWFNESGPLRNQYHDFANHLFIRSFEEDLKIYDLFWKKSYLLFNKKTSDDAFFESFGNFCFRDPYIHKLASESLRKNVTLDEKSKQRYQRVLKDL